MVYAIERPRKHLLKIEKKFPRFINRILQNKFVAPNFYPFLTVVPYKKNPADYNPFIYISLYTPNINIK